MLRSNKIRQYLAAMQSRGYSGEAVLAGSGLSPVQLASPSCLLSVERSHTIVANILKLTGRCTIGIDIGKAGHLTDLGIVGYAMASCRTLRQAVELAVRYYNWAIGIPMHLRLVEASSSEWRLDTLWDDAASPLFAFYLEESLTMCMSFGPIWMGKEFVLKSLHLAYPKPLDAKAYEDTFRCPCYFDAKQTAAVFSSPSLDTPFKGRDDQLNAVCLRHCEHELMRPLTPSGPVSLRIRSLLIANPRKSTSLVDVAATLCLHERALRRALQKEGTSFQRILDETRYQLALSYLNLGSVSSKEVGYLVGFDHPDAFRRAFKTWTGKTVSAWRADLKSHLDRRIELH